MTAGSSTQGPRTIASLCAWVESSGPGDLNPVSSILGHPTVVFPLLRLWAPNSSVPASSVVSANYPPCPQKGIGEAGPHSVWVWMYSQASQGSCLPASSFLFPLLLEKMDFL